MIEGSLHAGGFGAGFHTQVRRAREHVHADQRRRARRPWGVPLATLRIGDAGSNRRLWEEPDRLIEIAHGRVVERRIFGRFETNLVFLNQFAGMQIGGGDHAVQRSR